MRQLRRPLNVHDVGKLLFGLPALLP